MTSYSAAGQAIALRVQIVSGSNTLYYLHSDHLGSTSLMTNSTNGNVIANTTARYYLFGGWRTEPAANLTDRTPPPPHKKQQKGWHGRTPRHHVRNGHGREPQWMKE